jgi:hypothetical protein
MLLTADHASISVPSTLKCSEDSSPLAPCPPSNAPQELPRHPSLDQPVAVLGKGRVIPDPIIHRQTHKPAEQQVVVQLLAQESFRADRVQHLQHQSSHQPLRSHRLAPTLGVDPIKVPADRAQRIIQQRSYPPQRMRRRDPLLHRHVAEEATLIHIRSAHAALPLPNRVGRTVTHAWQFSTAC